MQFVVFEKFTSVYLFQIAWEKSCDYLLTIIPRVWMGYESTAHEAEGPMCYWFKDYEGERNNCFSKIQLVGQKNEFRKLKLDINSFLPPKQYKFGGRFSLLVGYNI